MFGDQRVDLAAPLRRDVRDNEILVGREAEIALVPLGNTREPGELLRAPGEVADPAVLDQQREMRAAVLGPGPAVAVAGRREREGFRRIERPADAALDLGAERAEAMIAGR